jgi:hypothetical protein
METDGLDSIQMLREAHRKTCELAANLTRQKAEVEANPSDLPAEQLARGLKAMDDALRSAQRVSRSLDEAMKIATISSN